MSELFTKVNPLRTGYDREQVEEFFAKVRAAYERAVVDVDGLAPMDIRRAAFDLARRGYKTAEVDAALDKLEDAFAKRLRDQYVTQHGQEAWQSDLSQRAQTLYERLRRPARERFNRPKALRRGYDARAVDKVLNGITDYFDKGELITSQDIRSQSFKRVAKWRAYDERQVDAYLAKAVDILLGVS